MNIRTLKMSEVIEMNVSLSVSDYDSLYEKGKWK